MLNLITLLDVFEDETIESIRTPQLVILPEKPSPLIGNAFAETFFEKLPRHRLNQIETVSDSDYLSLMMPNRHGPQT